MRVRNLLAFALCFFSISAFGQEVTGSQISGTGGPDIRTGGNRMMSVRSRLPEGKNSIDYQAHLFETGRDTQIIMLKGDTITGWYKYNMETESLDQPGTDNSIPWNVVKSFTFAAQEEMPEVSFSNIKLVWPESEYGGFIQDVKTSAFVKVKHYLQFVPSNYDPSTEIGSMKDQIIHEETRYLKVGKKWLELPDTKGAFYNMFGNMSEPLRKQARKNKWKYKNPEDIGRMVSWVAKTKN